MGSSNVTIRDVARLANTSVASVSRVLSGKPGVGEGKREQIKALAEKLGYRPNRVAQNLAMNRSRVIGIIASDLRMSDYVQLIRSLERKFQAEDYQILIADSEQELDREKKHIDMMMRHQVDGLLIFPVADWRPCSDVDHLLRLKLKHVPFVIAGKLEGYGFDCVYNDDEESGYRLASHLLDLGHRRLGIVAAVRGNRSSADRCAGVCRAMREAGLLPESAGPGQSNLRTCYVDDADQTMDSCLDVVQAWMREADRPTALIPISDNCALHLYRPLDDWGFSIPGDVSIATFGHNEWDALVKPSLTVMVENNEGFGRIAAEMLFKRIQDESPPPRHHRIPKTFIQRESTGRCPAPDLPASRDIARHGYDSDSGIESKGGVRRRAPAHG